MASSNNLSSAEVIGNHDDLILQILISLPVISLLRFKSVCKRWFSLISDPQFCHHHTRLNSNKNKISGVFFPKNPTQYEYLSLNRGNNNNNNNNSPPFISLDFIDDPEGVCILQSCNGLLLCRSRSRIDGNNYKHCVFNPTTKKFRTLPLIIGGLGLTLAFDSSKTPQRYKVICFRRTADQRYEIMMFFSETESWKPSGCSPFAVPNDMIFHTGVFVHDSIYWSCPNGHNIVFNVNDQCLRQLSRLPLSLAIGAPRFRHFDASGGHLYFFEIYYYMFSSTRFDIYEMDKESDNWIVKYGVDLDPVVADFPEMIRGSPCSYRVNPYLYIPMSFVREEVEENSWLLLYIPGKLISYNLKDRSCKLLYIVSPSQARRDERSLKYGCMDAHVYVETLASV